MGACATKKQAINPGSALDKVISQASSDDCVLYRLADYKKGGRLIEEYNRGGGKEVERLILEEFGIFMYNHGRGKEITRTEYLKWKYRKVPKDQMVVQMETKSPFDPLHKWSDHEACWQMQFRGSLGETLLHVLIMCDTKAHTRVAKILLRCFPKLGIDVVEGEEYLGAGALHLAIAYSNNELVTILMACGVSFTQRAIGSFFLPRDQQVTQPPGPEYTDYEGLAYLGEYPLAWSACLGNETVYNKLLDLGADPNLQDSFGNMILHMVVVCNQLGMFSYALRHPRLPAQDGIMNLAGLTPLTLACKLARSTIFKEMLELTCIEFWRYSNITCSAYPLNALDTIRPSGETNWNSALMIILNGTKSEHLDMLEGGIIQRLLEEKWKTFARNSTEYSVLLYDNFYDADFMSIARYCFETGTLAGVISYVVFQQGEEIMNQGLSSFMRGLSGNAPKAIFLLSNLLIMLCVPCRVVYFFKPKMYFLRDIEDELMAYAVAGSWFMLMFFAGALKLTGPFVVMIYKMITGDMFTFSIIYFIMLLGFSEAFFFLYKSPKHDKDSKYATYGTTWMALFHMTLGDYDNIYSSMSKFVFLVFTIMLPIMLLNMLIAMMGNTYSTVISMSEKEWVKAWAKIVIALERAISQEKAKDYLYMYSLPLGGGGDGVEESLGVMVIKSKDKTKAKQRKGALSNWKRVGRVTIDALQRRGVSGEFLRREMWGLQTAASTPVKGPAKKKGYGGLLGIETGPATSDIMGDALNQSIFAGGEIIDPNDEMDGFGALTGAIDQLAFTNDLDFSGDGIDDDPLKPNLGHDQKPPVYSTTLQVPAEPKKKKKKRRNSSDGYDNPAFIDDEELLLASALDGGESDGSDTDMLESRRLAKPRIIIRAETEVATVSTTTTTSTKPTATTAGKTPGTAVAAKDPKAAVQTAATNVPVIIPRQRLPSAKMRRIGSARKTPARFAMTFTEKYDPVGKEVQKKVVKPEDTAGAVSVTERAEEETKKKDDKKKGKKSEEEATTSTMDVQEEDGDSGDKWAEKKPRRHKNKVGPSNSSEECVIGVEAQTQDDMSIGLHSGTDSTREEVKAKDKERPKTSVASQKMKKRATENVGNMNSILPWDNEDGDIK
ncbi:Transient receptor potential cation channel subfamily V member 6-like [Homarus americanus]|uniref:Transient receptor potential cation channel subfamily V member 6-like n=1 Tax=Homarus americanus TaxID=6706 RepID=A0A8J5JFA6_HOMAM|nr:Transient receptor potential cation channel subfamily V member 6-like [Homarus americanus]